MNYAHSLEKAVVLWRLANARLRARFLSARGAHVGVKTGIGPRCAVERPWCVSIGRRAQLEADTYLKVVADDAVLSIGDHTFVGRGVEFDVIREVRIGSHTLIAPNCFITDHTHAVAADARIDQQPCVARPVIIGSDVWLGTGTVVLSGVCIGDGAVVGANSVVTRDVAAMTIVAGAPARFLRQRTVPVAGPRMQVSGPETA